MATRTVYDVAIVCETNPAPTYPPESMQNGTIFKMNNVGSLTSVKQLIDDNLTNQITPIDPSNPPKPLLSIKVMRKQIYEEDNP